MSHRYWRMNIAENFGAPYCSVAELEFRESLGGSDATGSGTASASSSGNSTTPAGAFDNNSSVGWQWAAFAGSGWLAYDFGVGVSKDITQVALTMWPFIGDGAPKTWSLQYSDDGSSWTTSFTITNDPAWSHISSAQTREYPATPTAVTRPVAFFCG